MATQESRSSEELSLLRRGLEPSMVENLKQSQRAYQRKGFRMTLEEVFYLEVEDTSILDQEEENDSPQPDN